MTIKTRTKDNFFQKGKRLITYCLYCLGVKKYKSKKTRKLVNYWLLTYEYIAIEYIALQR